MPTFHSGPPPIEPTMPEAQTPDSRFTGEAQEPGCAAIRAASDSGFTAGTIAALAVIASHDHEVAWREVLRAAGEDVVIYYAAHIEPEDWEWGGFARYRCQKPPIAATTPETGNPASADDERDAARYRWLRDVGDSTWAPISQRPGCTKETIDKAIDAAIAAQGERHG